MVDVWTCWPWRDNWERGGMVSASRGEGLDAIPRFLAARPVTDAHRLPVLESIPACHAWARKIEKRAGFRAPGCRVDAQAGRRLLHKLWGGVIFVAVVIAVFQLVFTVGQPLSNAFQAVLERVGQVGLPGWRGVVRWWW